MAQAAPPPVATPTESGSLENRYKSVRSLSTQIAAPLSAEDCAIQSMPDVSPTRWHLAHTTWFFETFILKKRPDYRCFDVSFEFLFNSYYNTVGKQFPRDKRGLISRPGLQRTLDYREHVDLELTRVLQSGKLDDSLLDVIELGIQHEQQHQELMLTDIKHVLSCNPLFPAYIPCQGEFLSKKAAPETRWASHNAGLVEVGHDGTGFAFDNEGPRHKAYIHAHNLATQLVTNGEFLEFVQSGGYEQPGLWLSMGWATVCDAGWNAPLYWMERDDNWYEFTLAGLQPLDLARPVCHVSFFEADAFARWQGGRLPTEFEWEQHASVATQKGVFVDHLMRDNISIHPMAESQDSCLLGNVWQWTSSAYLAYPGFAAAEGALGEYNGKFMCNQFVLRGGSCATSSTHIRPTYRNFFAPQARWQFSGIRLAQ